MKLRNKKTGKIVEGLISAYGISGDVAVSVMDSNTESGYTDIGRYETLARLNEEWEDYKPTEPLIKIKKVRKAVRAWAEANGLFEDIEITSLTAGTRFSIGHYDIEFMGYFLYDLESNRTYTIAELCGEEEE